MNWMWWREGCGGGREGERRGRGKKEGEGIGERKIGKEGEDEDLLVDSWDSLSLCECCASVYCSRKSSGPSIH